MTIDDRTRDIAKRLLAAELRLRDQAFLREIAQVKEGMNARGALRSGMTVVKVTDLAAHEFRARIHLGWDTLLRVLSEVGVTIGDHLRPELIAWIEAEVEDTFHSLMRRIQAETSGIGFSPQVNPLQDEAAALKREFEARTDLLIASLERRSEQVASTNVMHFYGTVGAVQTGALSTASISQHIGQADLTTLSSAVDRVAEAIGALSELPLEMRGELPEVIEELRSEIGKTKPNSIRLRQLAMGVATTIQTIASARPAYEALKAALIPLGVVLP